MGISVSKKGYKYIIFGVAYHRRFFFFWHREDLCIEAGFKNAPSLEAIGILAKKIKEQERAYKVSFTSMTFIEEIEIEDDGVSDK